MSRTIVTSVSAAVGGNDDAGVTVMTGVLVSTGLDCDVLMYVDSARLREQTM